MGQGGDLGTNDPSEKQPKDEVLSMKPKTMILMVVAVACGLGASYMTSKLLADRGKVTEEVEKVDVVVAKEKIPSWQVIKEPEKQFEVKKYLAESAPKNAISDINKLKD